MNDQQTAFINLIIDNEIMRFGEFSLKSGRISPYFFNAGLFNTGHLLSAVGEQLAHVIHAQMRTPYMLYGPAYKGIPLASAAAIQLSLIYGGTISYAFNRKETKDHGEGGTIVGAPLQGNVVIIDDVITAGTSINESVEVIRQAGAKAAAVVIALDRQEVADGQESSAVQQVEDKFGLPVYPIIKLDNLIDYLNQSNNQYLDAVKSYRKQYGC